MDSSTATLRSGDDYMAVFPDRRWSRRRRRATHFALTNPMAIVSALFLIAVVLTALLADFLPLDSPSLLDPRVRLHGPSGDHLLGTDSVGRDVLARLIYGARPTLYIAFAAVILSTVVGTAIGLVSGYFGGLIDDLSQRIVETAQAFPALILAMLIVSLVGVGREFHVLAFPIPVTIIPIFIIFTPGVARIVRGSVLSTKRADYVTAAATIGAPTSRILVRHILPNISAPILVLGSLTFGTAILVEASLSFLGLGTQVPHPSWGGMLSGDGRKYLQDHSYLMVGPAAVISCVVLSVNILGDTIRDVLDPVLRNR